MVTSKDLRGVSTNQRCIKGGKNVQLLDVNAISTQIGRVRWFLGKLSNVVPLRP
jgi:hypothetical protein